MCGALRRGPSSEQEGRETSLKTEAGIGLGFSVGMNTYTGTTCSSTPATVARKAHKGVGTVNIPRMEVNWGEDMAHLALITGKKQIYAIHTGKIPYL